MEQNRSRIVISRRAVIQGGLAMATTFVPIVRSAAAAVPPLNGSGSAGKSTLKSSSNVLSQLEVSRPSSTDFGAGLAKHFPGFAENPNHTWLQPYLLIVRNPNKQALRALHARWTLDLGGKLTKVGHYEIRNPSPALGKHLRSGMKSILRRHSVALVSPFFVLSSRRYKKLVREGKLEAYLNRKQGKREYLKNLLVKRTESQVTGYIGGFITERHMCLCPNSKTLIPRYITISNAEHDVCLTLRRQSQDVRNQAELATMLDASTKRRKPNSVSEGRFEKLYFRTKRAYSSRLMRLEYVKSTTRALSVISAMSKQHRVKVVAARAI